MYRTRIDSISLVLKTLLEKSEKVVYHSIQGHGLYDSQFDTIQSGCTRRIFNNVKNELVKNKFITKLKSKGRQKNYYTITPLGVVYLCSISKIDIHQYLKMFEFLEFFYENHWNEDGSIRKPITLKVIRNTLNLIKKHIKKSTPAYLLDYFELATEEIKITTSENATHIQFSFTTGNNIKIDFGSFRIENDKIRLYGIPGKNISESEFHYMVAEHVIFSFFRKFITEYLEDIIDHRMLKELRKRFSKTTDKTKKRKYRSRIKVHEEFYKQTVDVLNSLDKSIYRNALNFSEKLKMSLRNQLDVISKNDEVLKQFISNKNFKLSTEFNHSSLSQ